MLRIALLIIVALALALPVQAKPGVGKKHDNALTAGSAQDSEQRRETFSPAERNLIRAFLLGEQPTAEHKEYRELPPGLQKKVARGKALPPGWQKKLAAGDSLDFQVYRQGESLPEALLRRLPPPPIDSEILQVENKIIRLNAATRVILDVFDLTPTR